MDAWNNTGNKFLRERKENKFQSSEKMPKHI